MSSMMRSFFRLPILTVLALLAAAVPRASAQTPTPTFTGDCCSPDAGRPGCGDPVCTLCVCEEDDLCCNPIDGEFGWDDFCVGVAIDPDLCAGECPCVNPPPTPGGDCCSVHEGPKCDVEACTTCVCETDTEDVCCTRTWDPTCVFIATDECAEACPCAGTPTATPTATPIPTPGGDCCSPHAGPECDVDRCQECVCETDSFCCDAAWDGTCVDIADTECITDCACERRGDCCAAHDESVGCDALRCQDCVCGLDADCCELGWDRTCAEEAAAECALDCACEPADCCAPRGEGVGCDDLECQDCVCGVDARCCDDVWDRFCVEAAETDCALSCVCEVAPCCEMHDGIGCNEGSCQDCVCARDATCCTEVWDQDCADQALLDCGTRCTCEGGGGSCCEARETPGCEDEACQACVCGVDDVCCSSLWDGDCVQIASNPEECADVCPCEPLSNCCLDRDEPGCEDTACQECVCGQVDSFCCDTEGGGIWDGSCVDIASNPEECAFACTCVPMCTGDCQGDGSVTIDDLIRIVDIAMGFGDPALCPRADADQSGDISVDEIIRAVNTALSGCP